MNRLTQKEVAKILKGKRLNSKDAVTDYAKKYFNSWSLSDNLKQIVYERNGSYSWSPRTTFLTEYREALAILIKGDV